MTKAWLEKFYIYLKDKYKSERVYMFIGYIPGNGEMYTFFQSIWYTLIFKPVLEIKWKTKWNVDVELVLQSMIDLEKYHKAIIVTWDWDFAFLIQYLYKQWKLEKL